MTGDKRCYDVELAGDRRHPLGPSADYESLVSGAHRDAESPPTRFALHTSAMGDPLVVFGAIFGIGDVWAPLRLGLAGIRDALGHGEVCHEMV